jgi:hypothetical protein
MRVAQKYFNKDNTRIVVTSKGSEVIPALEKLGYKINFFDKEGNPVEKPKMPEAVTNDVTPAMVLDKYFKAVGGKDKLETINSIEQVYEFTMQGMSVQNIYKMQKPNKMNAQTIVMGQPYGTMIFDGTSGYMNQMGKKIPLPEAQLTELKAKKGIIDELYLLENSTTKIEGIEKINGSDAYKMSIESKGNKSVKYFDLTSGLLVKEEKLVKAPDGSDFTIYSDFMDYKPVNGILISHKVATNMMGQDTEMIVKSVEINKIFAEDTFK